ncbi:MAG: protein kinase [Anaerolineae bacterium]|nr:protein kinase [Anaerolineae bacterium]
MQLKPGSKIGEYKILEVIGNGGYGVVYKAEDTNLLRPVAVKQLSPEVFSEEGTRDWFIREARLSASLNHPNIVSTYALREKGDALFLIMEYLSGGDLHTLIEKNGPLDRAALLQVSTSVCRALETLHARNIIHRDIKPENILITQEGHFKLADFGLAHVHQAHFLGADDATGPQPGTLLYMSPEQALGEEVTVRTDIYSLAVVLYEAMTGRYYLDFDPYSNDDEALLALITDADPVPPTRRHASVPGELDEPLLRALSKDPAQRPASARVFLAEIKNAVSRSKHKTLSKIRRTINGQQPHTPPELLQRLYAIRTLRDAKHQPAEAEADMRLIWNTYPGVPEVAGEWGETLIALGRVEEGREWLERAITMKPDLVFVQLALADLLRNLDENDDEADDAVVAAIHADPDLVYAVLYDDLMESLSVPDTYEAYLALFQRAAEEQPTAIVLHNLGQVLALPHDREEDSIAAFERALEIDPEYGPAYVGLSSLLIEMGNLDSAIEVLEQATYLHFPVLPPYEWHKVHTVYQRQHAFLSLAIAYAEAGQYENSAIAACTVLEMAPDELEEDGEDLLNAYIETAHTWIQDGKDLRAYKFLNQIIPLAAIWGNVEIFSLLNITHNRVDMRHRRKPQWSDAIGWLKTSLLNLHQAEESDDPANQKPAVKSQSEIKQSWQ